MNNVKIKFCGLFREEDIEYVNKLNPDYIGFVFAKSKRQITKDKAVSENKKSDNNKEKELEKEVNTKTSKSIAFGCFFCLLKKIFKNVIFFENKDFLSV